MSRNKHSPALVNLPSHQKQHHGQRRTMMTTKVVSSNGMQSSQISSQTAQQPITKARLSPPPPPPTTVSNKLFSYIFNLESCYLHHRTQCWTVDCVWIVGSSGRTSSAVSPWMQNRESVPDALAMTSSYEDVYKDHRIVVRHLWAEGGNFLLV